MPLLYDHLARYGITKPAKARKAVSKLSKRRLERFFAEYREIAKAQPLLVSSELGLTDLYPDSANAPFPVRTIKQLALYANRIYVHDPLLSDADRFEGMDADIGQVMEHRSPHERLSAFQKYFGETVEQLLKIKPLVDAGIVCFSRAYWVKDRRIPGAIYTTDFYGPSGQYGVTEQFKFPPAFERYLDEHLTISNAVFANGKARILPGTLKPSRMIAMRFDKDYAHGPHIFCLSTATASDRAGPEGKGFIKMEFPFEKLESVDPEMFRSWVNGERQNVAKRTFNNLYADLVLSAYANATLLTTSSVTSDLMALHFGDDSVQPARSEINALMSIPLPYFDRVSFKQLVRARKNEESFHAFRTALRGACEQLDAIDNESQAQKRVNEIFDDLIHRPLAEIEGRIRSLSQSVMLDATVIVGSLITSVVGGSTLLSAAMLYAANEARKSYGTHKAQQLELRKLPGYFYWAATKGAKK